MKVDLHVRLPTDLHATLTDEAKQMGISLNAVVVIALRYWERTQDKEG